MNQNLHKLIGTKMKSGNKGVRGMSIKNMEKFIKNHGQSLLRIKRDRMSLGKLMAEFKEGRNKLEEGRSSPKKSMSPKKNTNNANFKTMMKSVKVTRNWANNTNSNLGSPMSSVSSKSSVSGYGSSPNEGKNFFVKPIRYRNTFAFNQAPKKGSVNIFPVKGYRRPLSKVKAVPKRTYLQVVIGAGKGTESIKAYDRPIMGKFPKEKEYNAPIGKSMGRKGTVPFNPFHFRPLRSNSPPRRTVAPSIPKKEPFVLKKFLESIKSKK
jgi:hypothetical protein